MTQKRERIRLRYGNNKEIIIDAHLAYRYKRCRAYFFSWGQQDSRYFRWCRSNKWSVARCHNWSFSKWAFEDPPACPSPPAAGRYFESYSCWTRPPSCRYPLFSSVPFTTSDKFFRPIVYVSPSSNSFIQPPFAHLAHLVHTHKS